MKNCENCLSQDPGQLIKMENPIYPDMMGKEICSQCYSELPEMMFVVNLETGQEGWIQVDQFNQGKHRQN